MDGCGGGDFWGVEGWDLDGWGGGGGGGDSTDNLIISIIKMIFLYNFFYKSVYI